MWPSFATSTKIIEAILRPYLNHLSLAPEASRSRSYKQRLPFDFQVPATGTMCKLLTSFHWIAFYWSTDEPRNFQEGKIHQR